MNKRILFLLFLQKKIVKPGDSSVFILLGFIVNDNNNS